MNGQSQKRITQLFINTNRINIIIIAAKYQVQSITPKNRYLLIFIEDITIFISKINYQNKYELVKNIQIKLNIGFNIPQYVDNFFIYFILILIYSFILKYHNFDYIQQFFITSITCYFLRENINFFKEYIRRQLQSLEKVKQCLTKIIIFDQENWKAYLVDCKLNQLFKRDLDIFVVLRKINNLVDLKSNRRLLEFQFIKRSHNLNQSHSKKQVKLAQKIMISKKQQEEKQKIILKLIDFLLLFGIIQQ
ncbi:unnamed protein product [Paramecium sonneborni]|uniref:Transmembrane protein n=1 Tax=Paramecium sonneborni TaxID=65129 RepID=A0A8S1NTG7_9CILI|nr:unnamed protein product [Paramecium sonneborni]